MPRRAASPQSRFFSLAVRLLIRRRSWGRDGDERAITRRARRVFGSPPWLRWLRTRDVRIEPVRQGQLAGEWVIPRSASNGTILYLHGGGYVACSPATHRPVTAALARLAQRRVFALDYRLAPEHRFPAALDDAVAGYRWLLDQGLASTSIALAGDSAGGGLLIALLVRLREAGGPFPACGVCFSPWTDLAGTGDSLHGNDGKCAMFHPQNILAFARIYLGDTSPRNPHASPVFADLSGLPPLLLLAGSTELLLDDARRVHEQVRQAGGSSRLEIYEGAMHGWTMMDGFMPEARAALEQAARFMAEPGPGPVSAPRQ